MRPLAGELGEWAAKLAISDIPGDVSQHAIRCIVDVTGVALAGATTAVGKSVIRHACEQFKPGACSVFGSPFRLSPAGAALANAVSSHAYDFDDTCYAGIVHGTAVVWPAVLAASQTANASGEDALVAFVAGVELEYALGNAIGDELYWKGWWNTATLGVIGSAVGAARALGLGPREISAAIGLAVSQPIGLRALFGTSGKPYVCGRAAQTGVDAALAARAGIAGPLDALDGKTGFAEVLNGRAIDRSALLDDLGVRFALVSPGIAFKLFPMCSAAQAAMEAARDIMTANRLSETDVETIVCEVPPLVSACLVYDRPKSASEAQFSMHFGVSAIQVFGSLDVDQLTEDTLKDGRIVRAMSKVTMTTNPALAATEDLRRHQPEGAIVTIRDRNGRQYRLHKGAATGMPTNPATEEQLSRKFRACAGQALSQSGVNAMLQTLRKIDDLPSLSALFRSSATAEAGF